MDYETVIEHLEEMHRYDHYAVSLCPFHQDNHPSFFVWDDGWFKCMSCDAHGHIDYLWTKIHNKAGYEIEVSPGKIVWDEEMCKYSHSLLVGNRKQIGTYLDDRGVESRIVPNKLGWYNGWYVFPIYDRDGKYVGNVRRADQHTQEKYQIRYVEPKNQGSLMYVPDWSRLKTEPKIFVVFGMVDALTLAVLGKAVVTSTTGQKSFVSEWLDEYRKPIIVIPDKGEEDAGHKLANSLGWRGKLQLLPYPEGVKDPNGYFTTGRKEELSNEIDRCG